MQSCDICISLGVSSATDAHAKVTLSFRRVHTIFAEAITSALSAGLKLPSELLTGKLPELNGQAQRAYLSNVCTAKAAQRQVSTATAGAALQWCGWSGISANGMFFISSVTAILEIITLASICARCVWHKSGPVRLACHVCGICVPSQGSHLSSRQGHIFLLFPTLFLACISRLSCESLFCCRVWQQHLFRPLHGKLANKVSQLQSCTFAACILANQSLTES